VAYTVTSTRDVFVLGGVFRGKGEVGEVGGESKSRRIPHL
jgi:hypothetical protein